MSCRGWSLKVLKTSLKEEKPWWSSWILRILFSGVFDTFFVTHMLKATILSTAPSLKAIPKIHSKIKDVSYYLVRQV